MTSIRPGISDQFLFAAGVEMLPDGLYSLRIPYHDWQGKLTNHNRWRLRNPLPDQKYFQEPDSGSHAYFSHLPITPADKLYASEGEFKCLSLLEAGFQAFGLPGLHCYTHEDPEVPPILLPGILEALQTANCLRVYFIGDSDTLTNLEFFRSAGVLSQGIPYGIEVKLIQLPLDGPKGIDDLRDSYNGEFPARMAELEKGAFQADRQKSFLLSAALALEARGAQIHDLPPADRERHIERIVRMAALARMSKETTLVIERFCTTAQRVAKLTKEVFTKSVEAEIKHCKTESGLGEDPKIKEKIAFYDSIRPWPAERPLIDIVQEGREVVHRFVITDVRHMLLSVCWAAHTFAYKQSPYLPMLVFTGAEEDVGKSTYMKVIGRMSYRAYLLIATLSIHRVLAVYKEGCYLLDESKGLADNRDMISFINAGFDNNSDHPVDSPILPRYDMETSELQEFDPRFPKMFAGIGTFLERDTLSRSLVIRMERYLLAESQRVSEYLLCTDEVTMPVYRAFLRYFTDERKAEFGQKCRSVIHQFPKDFRSRRRLKFVPLLGIAEMGGPALYEEVMEDAKWMNNTPDKGSATLGHRLICDIARCYYRQVLLYLSERADPATGQKPVIVRRPSPESFIFPTVDLVKMLLQLPEGGWRSYGRDKRVLNDRALYDLLEPYGLESASRRTSPYKTTRGVLYGLFLEKYGRNCRIGDPTLKSVTEELEKEFGPSDDSSGGSAVTPDSPVPKPPLGGKEEEEAKEPQISCDTRNIVASPLLSIPSLLHFLEEQEEIKKDRRNKQVSDVVALKGVMGDVAAISAVLEISPPPSTPSAGFCIATHSERLVGVDTETFFPWPSEGEITAKERRRRKDGKAHLYAKDPRRNAIRLLTISTETEVRVFDLFTETVPDDVRDLLRNSTLILHNSDFDATVLRRHGFELSSSIFDTLLAAQLLSLGEVEPKRRKSKPKSKPEEDEVSEEDFDDETEDEDEEASEFEQTFVPVSNKYDDLVRRYLGITLEKTDSKLGASDWSVPLSPAQLAYARDDVAHLHALRVKLTEELHAAKLWENFKERSEFLVHLNNVKFGGIPADREMLLTDKAASETLLTETKTSLREMFKDYRPLVPKSRRSHKKSKLKIVDAEGAVVIDTPLQTEEINPGYHVHIKAALATHGIEVDDTKKATLSAIDTPETRAFCRYAEQTKLLGIIKGIEKSIFHDGRVRSAQWNQLVARSGRIIPREPNVQQLPRKWRQPFRVLPPWFWLKMDLSQIEIYILAIHCQCPYLIELLRTGKDVYVEVAAEIFGRKPVRGEGENEVSEILRETAKTLVLGIAYCLLYRSFIRRVEIATRPSFGVQGTLYSMEEAKEFYAKFFEMFPEVKLYQDKMFEDALTEDFVYTATGQRRFLPPLLSDEEPNGYWKSRSLRHHILVNTPVQGGAACHYIRSINKLVPRLLPSVELIHFVHDEVGLLVTQETAQATIETVTQAFREAFTEIFGSQLMIQMEPQLSDSWAKVPKQKPQ
jgi:DNA polymerase I-like protein with 3'-5' exonuclease and polymerase domains